MAFQESVISARICHPGCLFHEPIWTHFGRLGLDHSKTSHTLVLRIARQDSRRHSQGTSPHALGQSEDMNEFLEPLQALPPMTQVAQVCDERENGLDKERFSLILKPWVATNVHTAAEGEVQVSKDDSSWEDSNVCMPLPTNFCQAGRLLEAVWQAIDKLENDLSKSQEEGYGSDTCYEGLLEAECKLDRIQQELCQMQEELEFKERCLSVALCEARDLQDRLREAELEVLSAQKIKDAAEARQVEELLQMERLLQTNQQILDKHSVTTQAINSAQELLLQFQATVRDLNNNQVAEKVIEIIQKEASFSLQDLSLATQELKEGKIVANKLHSELQKTMKEMKEKSLEIASLKQELVDSRHIGNKFSEALSRAEKEVLSLSQKLMDTEKALEKEKEALGSARKWVEKLEEAHGEEESKVDDLFKEVTSLKGLLEQKDEMLEHLSKEARGYADLLARATKHTEALHLSEKQVEQLTAQICVLESQVESRDLILEEIKEETFKSTDALRIAAQIKQDLNVSRQREVELTQELERQSSFVKELQQELNDNSRAMKAEQALRQADKVVRELTAELNILKKGIHSRDEAIKLMQDEIDRNIHILRSAADDREVMRNMQVYISNLESKLKEIDMMQLNTESHAGKDS